MSRKSLALTNLRLRHVFDHFWECYSLEGALEKMESMKVEMRNVDKKKREMSSQIDDLAAEVSKEKKLRSRSEHYSKQLEDEIEILKVHYTMLAVFVLATISRFRLLVYGK